MGHLVDIIEKYDYSAQWPWMHRILFGNSLHNYFICLLTFIAVWALLLFLRSFLKSKVKHLATEKQSAYWRLCFELLRDIRSIFYPTMALYVATRRLDFPPTLDKWFSIFFLSVLVVQIVQIASELLVFFLTRNSSAISGDLRAQNTNRNIVLLVRFGLWMAGALFILDNAGFNVGTFIAGLGIGGVAIALASQAILGDTFSSFAISLDKPFVPGDYIVVDNFQGTIELIGLKTTRVRSISGEMLVFSNSDLCKSRLRNFKQMAERRISVKIGVTYDTDPVNLRKLPKTLQSIVESTARTRFDRAHFAIYGDFALIFELVYYVLSKEMIDYMDVQQDINFKILEEFSEAGISIAFPTQTIQLQTNKLPV